MSKAKVIFDDAFVAALYAPQPGDTLFISFNAGGDYKDNKTFAGDHFLRQEGWAGLGIIDKGRNWFPKVAMIPLLQAVRSTIAIGGYRRIITWGVGMGGYGALRFASDLGAEMTFAFSPQTSIDPAHTGFPNQFWGSIDRKLRDGMLVEPIHLAYHTTIIYDPTAPQQRWYGEYLRQYPNTRAVLFPFTGNDTLRALAESGQQRAFFDAVLLNDLSMARRLLRLGRRHSTIYYFGRMQILEKRGATAIAFAAAQAGFTTAPTNTRAAAAFARLAMEVGEPQVKVIATLLSSPLIECRQERQQRDLLLQITSIARGALALDLFRQAEAGGLLALSPTVRATVLLRVGAIDEAMPIVAALSKQPIAVVAEWDILIDALIEAGKIGEALSFFELRIEAAPRDLQLRLRYARALAAAGLKVPAKHAAEAADALDNLSLIEMRELMKLHRELGALHRIERLAKLILSEQPEFFEIRAELINNHLQRQELTLARSHLEAALRLPTLTANELTTISTYYEQIIFVFGKIHPHRQNAQIPRIPDEEMALPPAQQAVMLAPDSLSARLALVSAYMRLKKNEEASRQLDYIFTQMNPVSAEQWSRIASYLCKLKRMEQATFAIRKAENSPGWSVSMRLDAARIFFSSGARSIAAHLILDLDLDAIRSVHVLGGLYDLYVSLNRDDLALKAVNCALKIDPYNSAMIERFALLRMTEDHNGVTVNCHQKSSGSSDGFWKRMVRSALAIFIS